MWHGIVFETGSCKFVILNERNHSKMQKQFSSSFCHVLVSLIYLYDSPQVYHVTVCLFF